MLNKQQIKNLKAEAHHLKPIFQIGKAGLSDEMIAGINTAISNRELIKISILQNCSVDKNELAFDLARLLDAEVVQIIGKTIVLYKKAAKNSRYDI